MSDRRETREGRSFAVTVLPDDDRLQPEQARERAFEKGSLGRCKRCHRKVVLFTEWVTTNKRMRKSRLCGTCLTELRERRLLKKQAKNWRLQMVQDRPKKR